MQTTIPYVTLEGSIGAGKTTLIKAIKEKLDLNVKLYAETFSKSQTKRYGITLDDFYKDKTSNSLKWQQLVQHHFAAIFEDRKKLENEKGPLSVNSVDLILGDRSLEEENVFRQVLFGEKSLSSWEYDICDLTMNSIFRIQPVEPDVRIILMPSLDTLKKRILKRNREAELLDGVDEEYLFRLHQAYLYYISFMLNYSSSKILLIGDDWDPLNPDNLQDIVDFIQAIVMNPNTFMFEPKGTYFLKGDFSNVTLLTSFLMELSTMETSDFLKRKTSYILIESLLNVLIFKAGGNNLRRFPRSSGVEILGKVLKNISTNHSWEDFVKFRTEINEEK